MEALATGPPAALIPNWYFEFLRDPLGFLGNRATRYGDVVRLPYGALGSVFMRQRKGAAYLLRHPSDVREFLVLKPGDCSKMPMPRAVRRLRGRGMLTSEGAAHSHYRRINQPSLHPNRVKRYAEVMVRSTEQMLREWESGRILDLRKEMSRLTMTIVGRTLFTSDFSDRASELAEAVTLAQHCAARMYKSIGSRLSLGLVPTQQSLRFRSTVKKVDAIFHDIIRRRRSAVEKPDDLLSALIRNDDDVGCPMTDDVVRNEALTMFLGGHETTASALTWTWYLLSQNPEVERRLHQELDSVLGSRPPTADDLPNLWYTRMVFSEAIRLYPPVWLVLRKALRDVVLPSQVKIPAGAAVLVSPYLIHRDPRFFPRPTVFDPARFDPARNHERPQHAYMPFGLGVRRCIGEAFANTEGVLIMASIARRFRLTPVPGQTAVPEALVTLRPRDALWVRPEIR